MSLKSLIPWTLAALGLCVLWDLAGQDLALAHWFGTPTGFPYRDHWLFSGVLHRGARRVAWTLQLGLVLAVFWPVGPLRALTRTERVQMLAASLAALLATTLLKDASLTSCPWELSSFGGRAHYVSHWTWGVTDGGEGNCFPAGHASAAFCFLSGFLALRPHAPRAAHTWLAIALAAGALIGMAQQVRGAHYMSHTLWTAWLCWTVCLGCYALFGLRRRRRS
jgi:membrane-associated PAP2 superfamily phosphatase